MARAKNHKPGLSPGEGLTYTPSNDATYTEAFNDYLKKRNINRNQAIGELITIALQTLKDSYDLPDPTAVHYMNNQIPIYPSPNLINHSREIPKSTSKIIEEKQDDTSNPLKKEDSSEDVPLEKAIENKRKVLSDFINTVSTEESTKASSSNKEEQNDPSKSEEARNDSRKNSTDINDLALMLKGME
ncbi:hypothetical protein MKY22_17050 [Exiguobacterium sp. FSL W8-0210]|uniref:hypothetical protein n=1 Tax=Exiguobacterium sp. FSL W8-0210 TaxID=2921598 RepID=UPI0030FC55A5